MTEAAARAANALDTPAVLARLDALVARALDNWRIPGLALALVLPGQAPVLRTCGIRDTLTAEPVTERTQFHACSVTKSVTAAGLLLLLEERGIPLTTQVRDLLPEFRLSDRCVTEQVSVRDLLCHASGLPRHDKIWTPGDLSLREMMDRMRHLALSAGLRERYQYSNLGYVVLALLVERLCGTDWETYTRSTLLEPLGFRDFGFSPAALEAAPDHAHPHARDGSSIARGKVWPAPGPAGGLNASIADMVRWLQFLLGAPLPGVGEERSRKVLAQMMTPWMYAGTSGHAEIGASHYGLGLACERYRGLRVAAHGGAMPGWNALVSCLPDEQAGIVVLTNRDPTPVPQMLSFALYDAVRALEPVDWYTRFSDARTKFLAEEAAQREKPPAGTKVPTRALDEYAGRYRDPAYGEVAVVVEGDALAWAWRGLGGRLKPLGYDRFRLEELPLPRHGEPLEATFLYDGRGRVDRLSMGMEAEVGESVFVRVDAE